MTDIQLPSDRFEVVSFATTDLGAANDQNSSPMGDASLEDMLMRWENLGEKFDRIASFQLLRGVATVKGIDVPVRSQPFNESGYIYIGATAIPKEELSLYMNANQADNLRFNLDQSRSECAARGRSGAAYIFDEAKDRILSLQDVGDLR
jgi:hypothetical protein